MLIFRVGLKILFGNPLKRKEGVIKDQFKPTNEEIKYRVEVYEPGIAIENRWISESDILGVMLKDDNDRYIWVDIDDLHASYPHDAEIGPDTIYKCRITGSRNSGRYPWSEYVNYMLHDEKAVKAFINWNFGRELRITPKKVIFNGPATIVMWEDGTKTIVKKTDGDTDDREKAVMYAILKKQFGSRAEMNRYLKQFFKEEHDE